MIITFVLLATIALLLLGLIWRSSTIHDLIIKVFLIGMSVWGIGIILSNPNLFTIPT
jgi:hypothetical protein